MLLGNLVASVLEDMLTGKGFTRVGYGSEQSKK